MTKNCTAEVYTNENYTIYKNNTDTQQYNHDEYSSQALKGQVINTVCNRRAIENVSTRTNQNYQSSEIGKLLHNIPIIS